MRFAIALFVRQLLLVCSAVLAYFGVRGLTEGSVPAATNNARSVLDAEEALSLDIELGLQARLLDRHTLVSIANWIYIWGHWPVITGTLIWLVFRHREAFYELRNAIFISGAIGLVVFALFPVTPPRLFTPDYVDTVTEHSVSYRLLQPPALVNKFAAVPSLHFGWNLLVALSWASVNPRRLTRGAAIVMPAAMAFAVVATGNHWVTDVVVGGVVALAGLGIEHARQDWILTRQDRRPQSTGGVDPGAVRGGPRPTSPVMMK